jgi:hypothetical protein
LFSSPTYKVHIHVTSTLCQTLWFVGNELLLGGKCFTGQNQIVISIVSNGQQQHSSMIVSTLGHAYCIGLDDNCRGCRAWGLNMKGLEYSQESLRQHNIETRECSWVIYFNSCNINAIIQCNDCT